ncbi:MAG: hypothetical protein QM752_02545 [Gammaproteobacteria bacterium]
MQEIRNWFNNRNNPQAKKQAAIQKAIDSLEHKDGPNFKEYMEALIQIGQAKTQAKNAPQTNEYAPVSEDKKYNLSTEAIRAMRVFEEGAWSPKGLTEVFVPEQGDLDDKQNKDPKTHTRLKQGTYREQNNPSKLMRLKSSDTKYFITNPELPTKLQPTPELLNEIGRATNTSFYVLIDDTTLFYVATDSDGDIVGAPYRVSDEKQGIPATLKATLPETGRENLTDTDLLNILNATGFTHLQDEQDLAANYHLNESTRQDIENGLEEMRAIYQQQQNQSQAQTSASQEGLMKKLRKWREEASESIQEYRTNRQSFLTLLGKAVGPILGFAFGFVEMGGSAFLILLGLGVPIIAAQFLGVALGAGLSYIQWKAFSSGTADHLNAIHGKDKQGEGRVTYHNEKGTHKLTKRNRRILWGCGFFAFGTGLTIGSLCYKLFFEPQLINIGIPVGFGSLTQGLAVTCVVGVAIAMTYMLVSKSAAVLHSGKSLIDYYKKPFKETFQMIDENPNIKHPNWAKGFAIGVIALCYATGIGGLAYACAMGVGTLSAFTAGTLMAPAMAALIIGIAFAGCISFIGRFLFTSHVAAYAAKAVLSPLFSKDAGSAQVNKKEAGLGFLDAIGVFTFNLVQPSPGAQSVPGLDKIGAGFSTGREVESVLPVAISFPKKVSVTQAQRDSHAEKAMFARFLATTSSQPIQNSKDEKSKTTSAPSTEGKPREKVASPITSDGDDSDTNSPRRT